MRNIDDSISDIYSIQEIVSYEDSPPTTKKPLREFTRINLDEIITYPPLESNTIHQLKVPKIEDAQKELKRINETQETNRLFVPQECKPVNKLYGSTKHLFQKQVSMDIYDETPFLIPADISVGESMKIPCSDFSGDQRDRSDCLRPPRHDSQESVQRIITERRKLDEQLKEFDQYDIFDTTHSSEENLVDESKDDTKEHRC